MRTNRHNEVIITLKLIPTWITLKCFTRYSQESLIFALINEMSNFKKRLISMVTKPKGVDLKSVKNYSLLPV